MPSHRLYRDPFDREIGLEPGENVKKKTPLPLTVFERPRPIGCMLFAATAAVAVTYFISLNVMLLLLASLLVSAISYLWRLRYNMGRKALLLIDQHGLTHRQTFYAWAEMEELHCAEEYDGERTVYSGIYLRFMAKRKTVKIYISGLSCPVEQIIESIILFKAAAHP